MRNVNKKLLVVALLSLAACDTSGLQKTTTSNSSVSTVAALSATATSSIQYRRYVYVASGANIYQYGINAEDHSIVDLDPNAHNIITGISQYYNLYIHPSGKWLYATMYNNNTTGMFKINDNGLISPIDNGVGPSCIQPTSIAFNSAGNLMYVTCIVNGAYGLISMTINPNTGALGQQQQVVMGQPLIDNFAALNNLTFNPAQKAVYDGSWSYRIVQGSLRLGIFYDDSLVTYAAEAYTGNSMAITAPLAN